MESKGEALYEGQSRGGGADDFNLVTKKSMNVFFIPSSVAKHECVFYWLIEHCELIYFLHWGGWGEEIFNFMNILTFPTRQKAHR